MCIRARGGTGWWPGQRVRVHGLLAPPDRPDLTVAVLRVRGEPEVLAAPSALQRGAERLRSGLRQAAAKVLDPEPAGLLPALVVGDTSAMVPAVEDEFRAAGLTHLTAVSGANVAIVCGAVLGLARLARAGPRTAAALAGLALIGFVVLCRPSPSVLRAAVMGGVTLLALVLGRRRSAVPALEAAVAKNPQVARFQFHLGMAYLAAGQPAQAHSSLQAALQSGLSGEEARSAQDALQKTGS